MPTAHALVNKAGSPRTPTAAGQGPSVASSSLAGTGEDRDDRAAPQAYLAAARAGTRAGQADALAARACQSVLRDAAELMLDIARRVGVAAESKDGHGRRGDSAEQLHAPSFRVPNPMPPACLTDDERTV